MPAAVLMCIEQLQMDSTMQCLENNCICYTLAAQNALLLIYQVCQPGQLKDANVLALLLDC